MGSFEANFTNANLKNGAGIKVAPRVKYFGSVNPVIYFSVSHFGIFVPLALLNFLDSRTGSLSNKIPVAIVRIPIRHTLLLFFLDLVPPKLVGPCTIICFFSFIIPRNTVSLSSTRYFNFEVLLLLTMLQN